MGKKTINHKILEEIERDLGDSYVGGVIVVKKSLLQGRTNILVEKITKPYILIEKIDSYLRGEGYDTLVREDNQEYHISLILKTV